MAAFRITLQATNFGNTEGLRASVSRSYLQTTLKLLRGLLLGVSGLCSPTNCKATAGSLLSEHSASNLPDDNRHSVGNTGRQAARSLASR